MAAIHIMQDGTERKSVEGLLIQSKEFYAVLDGILKKTGEHKK